jgi:hypothetical protein
MAQTRLVSPPVEGYFVAHDVGDDTQSIREEIPVGETLQAWTSMITTQRLIGVDSTALQFAKLMQQSVAGSCPEVAMSSPHGTTHQDYPAASFSATCYREEEGEKPETFFVMIVEVPDALLVKQVAFREDASRENMMLAVKLLRSAIVCDEDCPTEFEN